MKKISIDSLRFNTYRTAWLIAAGVVAFLIPFVLQYEYLINTFYHFGAVFNDTGWLANTIFHNSFFLPNARAYADYSILAIHLYLLYIPLNLLSYLFSHVAEFYAFVTAANYALYAIAMLWALTVACNPRAHWQLLLMTLLAVAYAFNGIIMQGIWMTHVEYFTPLGIFAFLISFVQRKWRLAALFMGLTLLVREDAGFHIVAVLALVAIVRFWQQRSPSAIAMELRFAGVAFLYSICAWMLTFCIRYYGYDLHESLFTMTFAGSPPYAHLSWQLLGDRLHDMLQLRVYFWLGFLVTMVAWAVTRNPYMPIGFIAYIPWFILDLTAVLPNTGQLYAYYLFPFVLSMGWPVIATLLQYGAPLIAKRQYEAFLWQGLLAVAGLISWNVDTNQLALSPYYEARWGSYTMQEGADNRAIEQDFIEKLDTSQDLGAVMLDEGMMSLMIGGTGQPRGKDMLAITEDKPFDTLVYFNPFVGAAPSEPVLEKFRKHPLPMHYCLQHTPICLFSDRAPTQLGVFSNVIAPQSVTLPQLR